MTRTTLVTGATAGIGEATTRVLLASGMRVIAAGRRVERLDALADELGPHLLPLPLDVTDAASIAALPKSLPVDWREVDVLVNNAGLALGQASAQDAVLADWESTVETNVAGPMRLVHAILPGMIARRRGRIINVGSVAARYPYPGGNAYAASKAFLYAFTANLKADLIGTGVHATTIAPGLVGGTEFSDVRFRGDAARAASVYEGLACMTPRDIAEAVLWVATRPNHVGVNYLELMPDCQAPGQLVFHGRR